MNNQRYFIMFLFDLTLAAIYAIPMSFWPFWECYINRMEPEERKCLVLGKNRLMFIPTFFGTFPILCMFFWQLYVAWSRVTTREIVYQLRKNDFWTACGFYWNSLKTGSIQNFYYIFGENLLSFFLFPWTNTENIREKLYKDKFKQQ